MLTLHKATEETKLLLKWGSISLAGLLVLVVLVRFIINTINGLQPPPPPTVSFGKLPKIDFPQNATAKRLTYTINTDSGFLPTLPDRATVDKIVFYEPNLLALQHAKEKMSHISLYQNPTALSETLFKWTDQGSLQRTMLFDIQSLNFTLMSNFLTNDTVLKATNLPNEDSATSQAKSFLSSLDSFPQDIDSQKTEAQLFSIQNGVLANSPSLSNAQVIRVDFFQADIETLPILYPHPPFSTMNVFIGSGTNSTGDVVEANFTHQEIASTSANLNGSPATYPIKTAQEAFTELKNHQAYIASYMSPDANVSITDVFLAYYVGEKAQQYLMPIIVFQGNNGFFAYVSAVNSAWVNE